MVRSPNEELLDLANIYDLDIDHIESEDYETDEVMIKEIGSDRGSHDIFD